MENPTDFRDRPAYRRIGLYLPGLLIGGLATLALLYFLAMRTLGWHVPETAYTGAPIFSQDEGTREVLFYVSPTTQRHLESVGGNYEVLLAPWRKHFSANGWRVQEMRDPAELAKADGGLLVLPSAVALSTDERAAIEAFQAKGGSLLATWASGTRDETLQWTGWDWLQRVASTRVTGEVERTETAPGFLVLDGETPVNRQQPAGMRVWLGTNHEPLLRLIATGDAQVAGRFMDWARTPATPDVANGAIVFGESAAGSRTVMFGFSESTWEYQPHRIAPLVEDSLAFLARRQQAVLAAWPAGRRAAYVVEMDTEQDFATALHLGSLMEHIGYRGTFYLLTSMASQHPEVVRALARTHEMAYHGEVHDSFKGLSEETQRARLERMRSELSPVLPEGAVPRGFRAPTEGYDEVTERLLPEFGINHHLADPSRDDARLPLFAATEGPAAPLVVLPRTLRDDINLLTGANADANGLRQSMADDLAMVEAQGALGVLSVHSQNFGSGNPLTTAVTGHLDLLASRRTDLWLASSGEVADWWRARDRVRVASRNLGARSEIDVSVASGDPVAGISLVIMLPSKGALPTVRGAKTGMPTPTVTPIDAFRTSVSFDALPAGNYHYAVTY